MPKDMQATCRLSQHRHERQPRCSYVGVEFRVTEEYDEDSPFSRPPTHPKAQSSAPTADLPPDTHQTSDQDAADTAQSTNKQGDGSSPALKSDPLKSLGASTIDTTVTLSKSDAQSASQSNSSTGRHQIATDAPLPDSIAEGIEVAYHPDDDQPETTELMDPVQQKPGVKRILDSKGTTAPSRSPQEQGLLPHPERQTRPESEAEGISTIAPEGQAGTKEKPWWETAAESAVGAFEGAKSTVLGGIESLTKGQGDKQTTGKRVSHTT